MVQQALGDPDYLEKVEGSAYPPPGPHVMPQEEWSACPMKACGLGDQMQAKPAVGGARLPGEE